jgi:hypothetical protein
VKGLYGDSRPPPIAHFSSFMSCFWFLPCQVCYYDMAMRLNKAQRSLVADKLMDSANLALAGLVFGELVTEAVRTRLLVLGAFIYVLGWITALRFRKGARSK